MGVAFWVCVCFVSCVPRIEAHFELFYEGKKAEKGTPRDDESRKTNNTQQDTKLIVPKNTP